jgi:hypothetical protein
MKKFLFFTVFFCFLAITGCQYSKPPSQASSQESPKSSSSSLYKITEEREQSIDGIVYRSSILIHKDIIFAISIYNRRTDGNKKYSYYRLALDYTGSIWMFLEKIRIRIDNEEALTLVDEKPYRRVTGRGVSESLTFSLRDNVLQSLRECNSFAITIGRTIEIPPEGIEKIKEFLRGQVLENISDEQVSEKGEQHYE